VRTAHAFSFIRSLNAANGQAASALRTLRLLAPGQT